MFYACSRLLLAAAAAWAQELTRHRGTRAAVRDYMLCAFPNLQVPVSALQIWLLAAPYYRC